MFVILEGVDGSGKSSLAKAVVREIERRHPGEKIFELHSGPLKRDPMEEYVFAVRDYAPGTKIHVVADRWHWGEQVYGPLYRQTSAIKLSQWRWMELWLQSRGVVTWLVTNTLEEINRRLQERGEDFLKPEHVELVIDEFNQLPDESVTYNGTVEVNGDITEIVDRIVDSAEYAESRARLISRLSSSYVGRTFSDPINILVGDKRGGQQLASTEVTLRGAFFPVGGNSGDFLLRSLPKDMWVSSAVININDDIYDLRRLFEWLENSNVVALGREAEASLKKLGFTQFGLVPHPQSIRRFHNSKSVQYGSTINLAASTKKDFSKWPN